jgi:hypothetical protein
MTKRLPFYNLPPSWNPGYAIPDYVMAEPPERGVFVTQWMPRGTIPELIPEFYAKPGKKLLGRNDAGLGSLGGSCFDENTLSGNTLRGSSLACDSLGAREFTLESLGAVPPSAAKVARKMVTAVKRLPVSRRGPAMKAMLNRINPKLHARATTIANMARARGAQPTAAIEHGIASALMQIGSSSPQSPARRRLGRVRGKAARGALGDLSIAAQASTYAPAVEGSCSADGLYKLTGGVWKRLSVGETCTTISSTPGPTLNTSGGGVAVTDVNCGVGPVGGPVVGGIPLAATEGAPVSYAWVCANANIPGLTREQRAQVTQWIKDAQLAAAAGVPGGGAFGTPGAAQTAATDAYNAIIAGKWPIAVFTGADGDGKQLLVTVDTTNPSNPAPYTFTWKHNPTAFETLDHFLSSLSPVQPEDLCSLIPMASKVPNPYVIAGSIVLQMSGKCPPSCPGGMLYDANTKTCACPPGTIYNVAAKMCQAPNAFSNMLPILVIGGLAVVGAIVATR